MSALKKLASETAVYGLSSVLGRVLNYLLVPVYTSVFLPGEYGIVTELYAYVAFLNILYVYGLETAYFRFAKEQETKTFNAALSSILVTSTVLSGTLWLIAQPLAVALGYEDQVMYFKWLAAIMAIDAIVAIPFARLRHQGKAVKFATFKLSNIGINITLNIFFIITCPWLLQEGFSGVHAVYNADLGVGYVFLSNLIANGIYLLFFVPTWLKLRLTFNFVEWKKLMKYAWPILIIGFAGVTNEMLSRAILRYRLPEGFYSGYSNLEILGIFGACYKLSVFMTLAIQAFRYAFEPFLFTKAEDKNSPKFFSKVMTYFAIFTAFSWLVLSVYMPLYAPIFLRQSSYLEALNAVPWLLGGGLFLGIFYNLSLWYKLTDNTLLGAYISIIGAISTFLLNWLLIPMFGYMGSAYATFISYFAMVVISYLWGRKHYPVPYEAFKVMGVTGLAGLGILFNDYIGGSIIISTLVVLIFLTLCFLIERRTLIKRISL